MVISVCTHAAAFVTCDPTYHGVGVLHHLTGVMQDRMLDAGAGALVSRTAYTQTSSGIPWLRVGGQSVGTNTFYWRV